MKRSLLVLLVLTGALVGGSPLTGSSAAGPAVGAVYTITNTPQATRSESRRQWLRQR